MFLRKSYHGAIGRTPPSRQRCSLQQYKLSSRSSDVYTCSAVIFQLCSSFHLRRRTCQYVQHFGSNCQDSSWPNTISCSVGGCCTVLFFNTRKALTRQKRFRAYTFNPIQPSYTTPCMLPHLDLQPFLYTFGRILRRAQH